MDMKTWVASKGLQQACKYIGKDPETGRVTDLSGDERFVNAYSKIINLTTTQKDAVFDVRSSKRTKYLFDH